MPQEIAHTFVMHAAPAAILAALTRAEEVQQWWTKEASMRGDQLLVGWSGCGWEVTLRVAQVTPLAIQWYCTRSNMQNTNAWEGTTITYKLTPQADGATKISFRQSDYRDSPCYDVCVGGWAFFVGQSLKQYVETGKGIPYPEMQDTTEA